MLFALNCWIALHIDDKLVLELFSLHLTRIIIFVLDYGLIIFAIFYIIFSFWD